MSHWQEQLDLAVARRFEQMIEVRRYLHMHPDPSGHEQPSSRYLHQLLAAEGFDVRYGSDGCGFIADPAGTSDEEQTQRIALRADIDALRIQDQKDVKYRSRRPGVMHACGHDVHTGILFGAIGALSDLQEAGELPWPVSYRGIFQPTEETSTGALEMIRLGALQGVGAILAVHVDPSRLAGRVGLRVGVLTANCVEMRIRIVGIGGHTARPHEASDPIAAAAQLINSIYLFIPRVTDIQEAVVVGIGQISSGDNPNVIPERLELRGTLRTLDRRIQKESIRHIRRLAHGVAQTTDTKIDVQFEQGSGSVCNDAQLIELLRSVAGDVVGDDAIDHIGRPSMGSEDFSFYLQHVPGAMIRLGCAQAGHRHAALHTPRFDVDEQSLALGARILARSAVRWCKPV